MADLRPFQKHFFSIPTLGRNFKLGDLYNYHTESILKDDSLPWKSTCKSEKCSKSCTDVRLAMKSDVLSCDTTKELMGLDNHLVASITVGLIKDFNGASTYIKHQPELGQAAVTFTWTGISRKKCYDDLQCLMDQGYFSLPDNGKELKTKATHLVVSVFYGAQTYCVFSHDLGGKEEDEEILEEAEKNLAKTVERFSEACNRNLNMANFKEEFIDTGEKHWLASLKCRMYLDLQTNPIVECDIFDAYAQILGLKDQIFNGVLDKKKMKAVPISVQICPLNFLFHSTEESCVHTGSIFENELVQYLCPIFAYFKRIIAKTELLCKKYKRADCSTLREFAATVTKHQELMQLEWKRNVELDRTKYYPEILNIILNDHRKEVTSFFTKTKLEEWLNLKQEELDMMDMMTCVAGTGITLLADRNQLDQQLTSKKYALVLFVPPLDEITNMMLTTLKHHSDKVVEYAEIKRKEPSWYSLISKRKYVLGRIRELAIYAEKNEDISNQCQWIITFSESSKKFGCSLSVFEEEKLVKCNLRRLPDPPSGLRIYLPVSPYEKQKISSSSVCVEWNYTDLGFPCRFLIEYRLKGSSNSWVQQRTVEPNQTQLTINWKTAKSKMEIRVAAETCVGRSDSSSVVDTTSALEDDVDMDDSSAAKKVAIKVHLNPPTNLKVKPLTGTMVRLEWTPPVGDLRRLIYHLTYWKKGEKGAAKKWESGCDWKRSWLDGLNPKTTYEFYIATSVERGQEKSEPSETVEFTTLEEVRFVDTFVKRWEKIDNENGKELYAVPLTKLKGRLSIAERFDFTVGEHVTRMTEEHRTILLIGDLSSGKANLINSMINYIFNVNLEDPFRFQLIDAREDEKQEKVTVYNIHHSEESRIEYSLTIINTPCYVENDPAKNQKITKAIHKFIDDRNGIQKVDVVGIVMDSSVPILMPLHLYIFCSLINIFGKDLVENIQFLLTSANNEEGTFWSSVINAGLVVHGPWLQQDGESNYHKFNSSIFSSASESGDVDLDCFHQGMEYFKIFFSSIENGRKTLVSVSKEMLDEKNRLIAVLEQLLPILETDLTQLYRLTIIKRKIGIVWQSPFEVTSAVAQKVSLPFGEFATNCTTCNVSCHSVCGVGVDGVTLICDVMDHSEPLISRSCRVCPRKCSWKTHTHQSFKWVYNQQREITTSLDTKKKYEARCQKALTSEELLAALETDILSKMKEMLEKIKNGLEFIKKLENILKRQNISFNTQSFFERFFTIADKLGSFGGLNEEINDEYRTLMDVLRAAHAQYYRVFLDEDSDQNYEYTGYYDYYDSSEISENTYYSEDGW